MKFFDAPLKVPSLFGAFSTLGLAAVLACIHYLALGEQHAHFTLLVFTSVLAGALAAECGVVINRTPKAACALIVLGTAAWFVLRVLVSSS